MRAPPPILTHLQNHFFDTKPPTALPRFRADFQASSSFAALLSPKTAPHIWPRQISQPHFPIAHPAVVIMALPFPFSRTPLLRRFYPTQTSRPKGRGFWASAWFLGFRALGQLHGRFSPLAVLGDFFPFTGRERKHHNKTAALEDTFPKGAIAFPDPHQNARKRRAIAGLKQGRAFALYGPPRAATKQSTRPPSPAAPASSPRSFRFRPPRRAPGDTPPTRRFAPPTARPRRATATGASREGTPTHGPASRLRGADRTRPVGRTFRTESAGEWRALGGPEIRRRSPPPRRKATARRPPPKPPAAQRRLPKRPKKGAPPRRSSARRKRSEPLRAPPVPIYCLPFGPSLVALFAFPLLREREKWGFRSFRQAPRGDRKESTPTAIRSAARKMGAGPPRRRRPVRHFGAFTKARRRPLGAAPRALRLGRKTKTARAFGCRLGEGKRLAKPAQKIAAQTYRPLRAAARKRSGPFAQIAEPVAFENSRARRIAVWTKQKTTTNQIDEAKLRARHPFISPEKPAPRRIPARFKQKSEAKPRVVGCLCCPKTERGKNRAAHESPRF
ncbi:hypothetical protein, conserved in T. vivax [Trypanosoma vivax Y486]|uniref:Uncharacterized protein n=1 Tax=Trypanosoma vivax (strain Y486) TaxID=1055687 RepID=F9WPB3_TRYVY|nr:hypothetical protein, conserved in T. vivax [Trypanosoma vivax Y486]|eukprot:CCD19389.1 hypothetical protein, conserved in T. vivax [Trypanosoma vivax Y486]